ncbi:glutathionylspermidine synthase family protein [Staphylospora marina]|uniref:glutathionylspermidine synthase family protein n=1 Tax=Staphylospora marina TaxID=2490858 RepID=UPI000F5C06C7|nr:glutathionylspermidine synthase family protein [Staphylospora marina]
MKKTGEYQRLRHEIYESLRQEGVFTWDWMYGKEYALADLCLISPEFRAEIADVTERLGRIFARTMEVVQKAGDELLAELGIPEAARPAVRMSVCAEMPTLVGRFDFARTPRGLKMLEFNSDTPTCLVEGFHVNGVVCGKFGVENPNHGMREHIRDAFATMVREYRRLGFASDSIVFSSLGRHEEDRGTTRYLLDASGLDGRFVPLEELSYCQGRLHARDGDDWRPVDVWYRLHPIELMVKDRDKDGFPTGIRILELTVSRRLAMINPPSALISQTKALQALIWNLAESDLFFTDEERQTIRDHMLPTYLDNVFHGKRPYVSKPVFGREGGGVRLYDSTGGVIAQDGGTLYWDQPMVYQELAELEWVEVETLQGTVRGKQLWGSFLIGGRASAIVSRVDQEITGNDSLFLPVGIRS